MTQTNPCQLPEPQIRTHADVVAAMGSDEFNNTGIESFIVYPMDGVGSDSPDPYEAGLVIEKLTDGKYYCLIGREETIGTREECEAVLLEYAQAEGYVERLTTGKRPIIFGFGGEGEFVGLTDGTTWNGFENVWVTEATHEKVREALGDEDFKEAGLEEIEADERGLYSYAFGYCTADAGTVEKLAEKFSEVLREWLTGDEMADVTKQNEELGGQGCASHDYCDANMAMDEAWTALFPGFPVDGSCDLMTDLVNAAWDQAKADRFGTDAEG